MTARDDCLRLLVVLALFALLTFPSAAAGLDRSSGAATGWDALWNNDYAKAEQLFSGALAADSDDQSARRGLVLAAMAQGKDDLMQSELREYGKRIPSSPFDIFLPGVVRQYSDVSSRRFYERLFDYAKNLGRGRDLPPVDRRVYRSLALQFAFLAGESGEVDDISEDLNRIDRWCVLGPFDNTSGSGHRKDHVDTDYVLSSPFVGKYGQRIHWFSPTLVSADRSIIPIQYFHKQYNTTAYVRTAVKLREAGEYLVSIGHEGATDFSINGVHIYEGSRFAGGDETQHWLVSLDQGYNLFSFKVSNRDDVSTVSCAISMPDGSHVDGISFEPDAQVTRKPDASPSPRPVEAEFLGTIDAYIEEAPDDIETQFWNLYRSQSYEEPDSTLALCEKLEEMFPESGLMQLAVGAAYGAAGDPDGRDRLIESAAELSPDLAPAVLHMASEDMEKQRYATARSKAERLLRSAPDCRGALELRLQCLLEEQKLEELREAAEEVTEKLDDEPLGHEYLAEHASARGLDSEEKRQIQKMVKYMPTQEAMVTKFLEGAEEEDFGEMERELKRLLKLIPDSEPLWVSYVRVLLSQEESEKAWNTTTEVLRSFPQSVQLLYTRALFVEGGYDFDSSSVPALFPDGVRTLTDQEMELMYPDSQAPSRQLSLRDERGTERWFRAYNNMRAAEILEDALAIDPGDFQLRDKIRSLRGQPSYRTFMPDPDIRGILALKVDPAGYEGEDAVVLLEQKRRLAYDEHASIVDYCIGVQMLNEEGIERWENYDVSINPHATDVVYLEHKTVKPDGTEFEADASLSKVIFKNVEPGDVLFLHYQSRAHVSKALSGNFWDSHLFSFSDPCLKSTYVLITPEGREVQNTLHNEKVYAESMEHRTRDLEGGFTKSEWTFLNPPRIGREPSALPPRSYLPWLDVTTIGDWGTVSEWYADLASGQAEVTRRVRRKADEVTEGLTTDEEKIAAVLEFVADEVTYQYIPFYQSAQVPREADEVLSDRIGDCKDKCTLMLALLDAAGVEGCRLALVTPWADNKAAYLPSPRFAHVIVCREDADGTFRWYDPTVRFPDPEQVPRPLIGVPALITGEPVRRLTVIAGPDACDYPTVSTAGYTLHDDGGVDCRMESSFSSIDKTSPLRTHVTTVSQSDLEEETLTTLAVSCPGVELTSLDVANADEPDSNLIYRFSFSAPSVFSPTGNIVSGSLPGDSQLTEAFGAIVAKKERTSPVDLRSLRMCERSQTVLEYPQGYSLVALPESQELSFGQCLYRTEYSNSGNKLTITRETVIEGDRVRTHVYQDFKSFLEGILQDMKTPLLFQR